MVTLTYYLDVLSSWCWYAEPQLAALRKKYGERLAYDWRIALITDNMPGGNSRAQIEWYYKRSGGISGMQLNPAWRQDPHTTLDANAAAEAARDLGVTDDTARLALARAALRDGKPIYRKMVAADVVAEATGIPAQRILNQMNDPGVHDRIRKSSEAFAALQIDQRPAFVLHSSIGDRAVFSGIWRLEPLDVTVASMLDDISRYERFAADNPPLPVS